MVGFNCVPCGLYYVVMTEHQFDPTGSKMPQPGDIPVVAAGFASDRRALEVREIVWLADLERSGVTEAGFGF